MSTLATYVWKEWRDQRATVFGILGVQLLTCALLVLFLQGTVFASTGMVTATTFGSIALTLIVFGPELIAGENQSGTLGFLCRMPSGLHWAFWAKVVFLLGAMACLVCTGFAISSGLYIATGQDWDAFVPQTIFSSGIIPGAVTLGLLLMAVSCWLPRAILTIPTTALLSALLILPVYFIWSKDLSLVNHLSLDAPLYFAPPLALGVLWLSLVRGRRSGGGPRSSACRGLVACLLAATPLWAWAGIWMHDWTTPRPREELRIWSAYMGTNGRLAFLNTSRKFNWPWVSIVVDLETGDWRRMGAANDGFAPIRWNDRFMRLEFGEHSLLKVLPRGSEAPDKIFYIDGATGEVVPQVHPDGSYAGILFRSREAARRRSPFLTPDGRRVWSLNGNLEMETEAGGFEKLPWDRRDQVFTALGFGLGIFDGGWTVPYDLTRHRLFHDRRFLPDCCWVLESHWLVSDRERTRKPPTIGGHFNWRLLDPDTGEEEVAMGMIDGDRVGAVLDDGRVLVRHETDGGESTAMLTVDPFSGRREPLTLDGLAVTRGVYERYPMRTPDGRRLFRVGLALTSLAPGSDALTPPIPMSEVIGCFDATTALILSPNRRRLERVDLLTGECEIVFPR